MNNDRYSQLFDEIKDSLDLNEAIMKLDQLSKMQISQIEESEVVTEVIKIAADVLKLNDEDILLELELNEMGFD